ncbi:MAG: GNAT family N-acetyltransferase [Anaeromyxobacter sp.]
MDVRVMRSDDLARVQALAAQLGYPVAQAALEERFAELSGRAEHLLLVALERGVVVGWLHAFTTAPIYLAAFAEVAGLVVDEAHRGRGAGAALMHEAERWAARWQLGEVRLRSAVHREQAHRFYERLGYARVKTQHTFVRGVG